MTTASQTEITVRPLAEDELSSAAEIEALCFSEPWSERSLLSSYNSGHTVFYGAFCGGAAAGYAVMTSVCEEGEIVRIAVRPDRRRLGAASALMRALDKEAASRGVKKLRLEVRAGNRAALSLYEKSGFYPVGVRRGYYSSPKEDAVLLDKDL